MCPENFIEKFHCTFFSLDYWVNNNNNNNNKPVEFNRTVFASETLGLFFQLQHENCVAKVAANFCFLYVKRKISKCATVFFVQYTSGVSTNDSCVYRVMDARGKFGEHERCVRVARGDSRVQLQLLECSSNFPSASITSCTHS